MRVLVAGFSVLGSTVTYTESGTPMLNWDSRYLCHFPNEMAEIWSLGTSFQDVWTYKISALYLLYFTFKVMKVFVMYLVISTKCFITMKVQEIES